MPKAKSEAEKRLEEQRKAQAETVAELDKRQADVKPTPTQDENDRAKLGVLDVDAKEPDGSPEQPSDAPPAFEPSAPELVVSTPPGTDIDSCCDVSKVPSVAINVAVTSAGYTSGGE